MEKIGERKAITFMVRPPVMCTGFPDALASIRKLPPKECIWAECTEKGCWFSFFAEGTFGGVTCHTVIWRRQRAEKKVKLPLQK